MRKFIDNLLILFSVYVIGPISAIIFLILALIGYIKVANIKNLPKLRPKMILVANHPDLFDCMYELFLVPTLFLPQAIFHPLKFSPWFLPDKHNFADKWFWFWWKSRMIPVTRGEGNGSGMGGAREMFRVLDQKSGIVIIFPERGRTNSGKNFLYSKGGKRIRPISESIGWVALKAQVPVIIPIWLENINGVQSPAGKLFSWPNFKRGQAIVKFGKPIELPDYAKTEDHARFTEKIAKSLLELADQE